MAEPALSVSDACVQNNCEADLDPLDKKLGLGITEDAETVNGRSLIHAMKFQDYYFQRQARAVDNWNRYNHFSATTLQWGLFATTWVTSAVESVTTDGMSLGRREHTLNIM